MALLPIIRNSLIAIAGIFLMPAVSPAQQTAPPDSTPVRTMAGAFRKGSTQGHVRSFLMATDNARQLSDHRALAAGGALTFQTAPFHGFRAGVGVSFDFHLGSTDLSAKDSITRAANRYETGLFDLTTPGDYRHLNRVEALWLQYEKGRFSIVLGKQSIQTPFINPQDGRMKPTAEEGVRAVFSPDKSLKIETGWLWRIAPRSTVEWVSIEKSLGLYPGGLNPDGTASAYGGHVSSKGIGLAGITKSWGKHSKIQVWEQWVHNVFNTVFVEAVRIFPVARDQNISIGIQAMHQNALADGGNADPTETYMTRGGRSNAVSTRIDWQRGEWRLGAAYTRVTADGRFLAPREWGREPFYTFMARERIEGSGDSHSATLRAAWQPAGGRWRAEVAYGHFYLPDVKNTALNKYGFPSFRQLNVDLKYTFGSDLKGLTMEALLVYKGSMGDTYGNDKYVINKVGMIHYDLMLNYLF
ncbi:MAG: OprD family outer membrane porin [Saprospiraceae bacterium]|nr:OprD family outer membrane porin [Saprospiraceae bacterium]